MKGSISSCHKPGKIPQGGNHDTMDTTTPRGTPRHHGLDTIFSLISSHKPGKTPRGPYSSLWIRQDSRHHEGQHFYFSRKKPQTRQDPHDSTGWTPQGSAHIQIFAPKFSQSRDKSRRSQFPHHVKTAQISQSVS